MYYIYEIYNDITQRRYIGLSANPIRRFRTHLVQLRNHTHTAENINKDYIQFGENHFFLKIVDMAKTKEEGLAKERRYILKYQSYVPDYGYNGNDPRWSRKHSPKAIKDSRLKQKIKMQGYELTSIPYVLGITYTVFVAKMNHPECFSKSELDKLSEYLEITNAERRNRFFRDKKTNKERG